MNSGTYHVVYWEGMKKNIQQYVATCKMCQLNKYQTLAHVWLLQPLLVPTLVCLDVSMNFIEGLPKAQGKNVILVVVDRLTKYANFIAMSHPFTAKDVAEVFLPVVKLHEFPSTIVFDRYNIFLSHFLDGVIQDGMHQTENLFCISTNGWSNINS